MTPASRCRRHVRFSLRALRPAVLLVAAAACWSVPEVDRRIINPWLICADCTHGELNRVVQHGARATRYLRSALADGPQPAEDSIIATMATETVARARRYRIVRGIIPAVSTSDSLRTVTEQVDEFRLRFRLRAAEALHAIQPADSTGVASLCTNPPPELVRHPEYRVRFRRYGPCP